MPPAKPFQKCKKDDKVVHKDHEMRHKNHVVAHGLGHQLHGVAAGHPAGALVIAGLWVASKLIHSVSKTWNCERCHHDFD